MRCHIEKSKENVLKIINVICGFDNFSMKDNGTSNTIVSSASEGICRRIERLAYIENGEV